MIPLLLSFQPHKHVYHNTVPLLRPALGEWRVPPVLNSGVERSRRIDREEFCGIPGRRRDMEP